MKLHPRHVPVEEARRELAQFLIDLTERRGLTFCERASLLAGELSSQLSAAVRWEREDEPAAPPAAGPSPPPPWHAGPPPRFGDGRTVLVRLKQETRDGIPCDAHGREYYGEPVAVRCWDDKMKTTLGSERVEYDEVTAWMEGPGGG